MKLVMGENPSLLYQYRKNSREEIKDITGLVKEVLEHMATLL